MNLRFAGSRVDLLGISVGGVITGYVYDPENRLKKVTYSDGAISTYAYVGDGLRRTRQDPGQAVSTMIWDGSDYLGEVN